MASHDLETILRVADRVWLMDENGSIREGIPESLAMDGAFTEVFSSHRSIFDRESGTFRFLEPSCGTLTLEG
ncbi:MAG: hypothetical protein ABEH38_08800, partial [Flavobacteriales bacterium]